MRVKRTEWILPATALVAWLTALLVDTDRWRVTIFAFAVAVAGVLSVTWVLRRWLLPMGRAFEFGYWTAVQDLKENPYPSAGQASASSDLPIPRDPDVA